MYRNNPKVLVLATSHKTHGGITSVVKAHKTGEQWKRYHCQWIETHIDGNIIMKIRYLLTAYIKFFFYLPTSSIVHFHVSWAPTVLRKLPFFLIAKCFRKKIIVQIHSGYEPINKTHGIVRCAYSIMFKYADKCIFLAQTILELFKTNFPIKNGLVIYNPCPKFVEYEGQRQKQILFAGRITEAKGYKDLIHAFANIAQQYLDWSVCFAGSGDIDLAQSVAKQLQIENRINFLGWVSGKAKDKAFREAAIFCLPSYTEGFPMSVLDAWAYGLPVITTPVGGIPDIVHDGQNMLLFNSGEIESLTSQLELMIKDEKLRRKLSAASYNLACTTFNVDNINKQIGDLYAELLNTN
ncbi:polysaccharide biosynthesis protein [Bacteroidia bacterium]|nr:polysaccharide biosynthesis protein [Bacteroidia bacterium]GHU82938.1 polysaccharide biosynthesis protein [Bacteroidia bacterium]